MRQVTDDQADAAQQLYSAYLAGLKESREALEAYQQIAPPTRPLPHSELTRAPHPGLAEATLRCQRADSQLIEARDAYWAHRRALEQQR
jgi:hypothetical protein